jgi:actin-like ATPase involved in cell morphogenesis
MIKLIDILKENNKILIPRRSAEERQKNYSIATQKKIQQYIKMEVKGRFRFKKYPNYITTIWFKCWT